VSNLEYRLDRLEQKLFPRVRWDEAQERVRVAALTNAELIAALRACAAELGTPLAAKDLEYIEALERLDAPQPPRPVATPPEPARREPGDQPVELIAGADEPFSPPTPAPEPVAALQPLDVRTALQSRNADILAASPSLRQDLESCRRCGKIGGSRGPRCPACGYAPDPLITYPVQVSDHA